MSRARSRLVSAASLSLWLAACAKLVGITDTPVTNHGEPPDAGVAARVGSGGSPAEVTVSPGAGGGGGSGGRTGAPSAAGSGGTGAVVPSPALDAGVVADAAEPACSDQATRCGAAGREVCSSGVWQASACPLNQPTCEADGQCVVRGPTMVDVGSAFLIDATEVTVGQYKAFLDAKAGDVSGQSAVCSWNQSYYEGPVVMDPINYPMTSVDWCDAAAYCSWAGKHLCGRIGGGPIARADIFDADASQWFVACGGGGFHPNDNPSTLETPRCNSGSGALAPVASFPLCGGFFDGMFDMEGNAAEWVDACSGSAGAADVCYPMGGSIFDNGSSFCDEVYENADEPYRRDDTVISVGFRCCAG
jgi:sulfatase modifying factor 1